MTTQIFSMVWTLPKAPEPGDTFGVRNRFGEVISTWEAREVSGGPRYFRVKARRLTPTDRAIDWAIDWNGS